MLAEMKLNGNQNILLTNTLSFAKSIDGTGILIASENGDLRLYSKDSIGCKQQRESKLEKVESFANKEEIKHASAFQPKNTNYLDEVTVQTDKSIHSEQTFISNSSVEPIPRDPLLFDAVQLHVEDKIEDDELEPRKNIPIPRLIHMCTNKSDNERTDKIQRKHEISVKKRSTRDCKLSPSISVAKNNDEGHQAIPRHPLAKPSLHSSLIEAQTALLNSSINASNDCNLACESNVKKKASHEGWKRDGKIYYKDLKKVGDEIKSSKMQTKKIKKQVDKVWLNKTMITVNLIFLKCLMMCNLRNIFGC